MRRLAQLALLLALFQQVDAQGALPGGTGPPSSSPYSSGPGSGPPSLPSEPGADPVHDGRGAVTTRPFWNTGAALQGAAIGLVIGSLLGTMAFENRPHENAGQLGGRLSALRDVPRAALFVGLPCGVLLALVGGTS